MIRGMLADQVDDWHVGPASIVQVREPVPEAGTEMQQRTRRLLYHPRIAVRSAGGDSLKQTERAPYFRSAVKRCDDVNFRGAWVREARVNARCCQGANQAFRARHAF